MNICLPVLENNGLLSAVSPHFGQAPAHLVVSDAGDIIQFCEKSSCEHGECTPVDVISQYNIQAVVCQGLGRGAFFRLRELGVEVFQTACETVDEALAAFNARELAHMGEDGLCHGHHDEGSDHCH
ncbi:MAG: NifB/NifX family molybdenum-iron cluster-binding protein [Puniceicoccales bacterium]